MESLGKEKSSATVEEKKGIGSKSTSTNIKFDDEEIGELDIKTVDLLTQKLAKDLSTKGFLADSDDSADEEFDDLSDDEDHDLLSGGGTNNNNEHQHNILTSSHHAATFLTTPPLSLDDGSVSKLFLPVSLKNSSKNVVIVNNSNNSNNISSKQGARPGSSSTPTSPMSKRPPSPSQNNNNNNNNAPSDQFPAFTTTTATTSEARLSWTSQPVHNEDVFDVNERVQNILQTSNDTSEKRRKMIPSFLQHLV